MKVKNEGGVWKPAGLFRRSVIGIGTIVIIIIITAK